MMPGLDAASPEQLIVRSALRTASVLLDAVGEAHGVSGRRPLVERLRGAIGDLFLAKDAAPDDPSLEAALGASAARLREAHGLLVLLLHEAPELSGHERALAASVRDLQQEGDRHVTRLLDRGARGRGRGTDPSGPRELLASDDLPRTQHLQRRPVVVFLDLEQDQPPPSPAEEPAPRPPPSTIAELLARKGAPEPAAEPIPRPLPTPAPLSPATGPLFVPGEQLRFLARAAFDDVTSLCLLRRPNPGESWLAQAPFERRLLAHLDALLSLGDAAVTETVLALAEVKIPDEARATAVALVLGTVAGSDTAALLLRLLRAAEGPALEGFSVGLLLAPSADLDVALTEALTEGSPREMAAGVRFLSRRGALPVVLLPALLARRDDAIDSALGFALGRAVGKARAHEWLSSLASPDRPDEVFLPALESLARRSHPSARELLREALGAPPESVRARTAARLMGAVGSAQDGERLGDFVLASPDRDGIHALGHLGSMGGVPALVRLLGHEDEALHLPAALALDRLAGPVLRVPTEVPFSPHAPPGSRGRILPRPRTDALAWQTYFHGPGARLSPTVRYRWGAPLSAAACVAEIGHPEASREDRDACALTLASLTGELVRFDADDWVKKQREQIASLSDLGGS